MEQGRCGAAAFAIPAAAMTVAGSCETDGGFMVAGSTQRTRT